MSSGGSRFTTDNGTRIDIKRLAQGVFVAIMSAIAGGYARTIGAFFDALIISPLHGLGEFLAAFVTAPLSTVTAATTGAANGAIMFVEQFGVLGVAVGVTIALATYYAVERGVRYV